MLDSAEVLTLKIHANVVVLSACETAVGRLEGQEGIATLSRAFSGIASDQTISVALRNAKLELLRTFGPKAVPSRWAAYTLEGADNYAIPFEY